MRLDVNVDKIVVRLEIGNFTVNKYNGEVLIKHSPSVNRAHLHLLGKDQERRIDLLHVRNDEWNQCGGHRDKS